jgi:hypothetical protein
MNRGADSVKRLLSTREAAMSSFAPSDWVDCSRSAINEFKSIRDKLPAGKQRDEINEKIKRAEDLLSRADAELAQKLGFELCKCAFPPKIMLWDDSQSASICRSCGHRKIDYIHQAVVRATRGHLVQEKIGTSLAVARRMGFV